MDHLSRRASGGAYVHREGTDLTSGCRSANLFRVNFFISSSGQSQSESERCAPGCPDQATSPNPLPSFSVRFRPFPSVSIRFRPLHTYVVMMTAGQTGDPPSLRDVAEDPNEGSFRWVVSGWSHIRTSTVRSETFTIGGFNWRLLIYPRGNSQDAVSVYLAAADADTLPYGWSQFATFALTVEPEVRVAFPKSRRLHVCRYKTLTTLFYPSKRRTRETDDEWRARFITKETPHHFDGNQNDWGFSQFAPLREMDDVENGLVASDNTVTVSIKVRVKKDASAWNYNSRKETGFVGLKNQGATCYMNSLLQTLFHVPYFRKAVYHMPTTEQEEPTASIPLALQVSISQSPHFAD